MGLFALGFIALIGRAFYLQQMKEGFLQKEGASRYSRVIEVPANRGRILDRNGEPLAVSTPVRSIWVVPSEFDATPAKMSQLGHVIDLHPREISKRIAAADKDFAYLRRQVPPEMAERLDALGMTGIFHRREYRRYYPGGDVMAHLLGFTGRDDIGQEGLELAYQEHLAGKPGNRRVIKDRKGHIIEDVEGLRAAHEGRDLTLALDSRIQNIAFRALRQAVADHRATGGGIVVIDAATGEIVALANVPTYNPNNRDYLRTSAMRNRVVTDAFEPGSTLKPFTVALALEAGIVTPQTQIQTAPGTFSIGPAIIRDAHPAGMLTVAEIIQKSSNVGSAKIALDLSSEAMWSFFNGLGFGTSMRLGFPGEATGKVRPANTWRPIEQATMSYGHGIATSLLQLARAYTIFARDGDMVPLTFVRDNRSAQAKQIVSSKTALEVRRMLEMAVQNEGTAPRAQVMGYRVAGKTGTARKLVNGAYAPDRHVASFVGFAPASAPRLVIAVMIDEPRAGQYYGGMVAAPVFSIVMGASLRALGVVPDAPMKPIELSSAAAELKEST
ncbi:MAG: penicillin-binding protein 2 [Betaproteobacteria bacterium]|nr:penicillin-binding protein 2 [Betaproteobacteria bacterium]